MRGWWRTASVTVALAVGLAASTGCAAMPSPFDGERSRADELPPVARQSVASLEGVDPSSARYQGQSAGYDLYLLEGDPPNRLCLLVTAGTADSTLGACSGGSWLGTTLADGTAFRVQLQGFDGAPDPTGIEVSPWVHDVTGLDAG